MIGSKSVEFEPATCWMIQVYSATSTGTVQCFTGSNASLVPLNMIKKMIFFSRKWGILAQKSHSALFTTNEIWVLLPRLQSAVSGKRYGQRIPICKNHTQVNFLTKWRNQKSRGTTIKHREQRRVPPWRQASRQLADGSRYELRSCVLFIINCVLLQIDTNIQAKKGKLRANNEVGGNGSGAGGWFCLMPTQTSLTTPPLTTCHPPPWCGFYSVACDWMCSGCAYQFAIYVGCEFCCTDFSFPTYARALHLQSCHRCLS